jgi:hypothetical protein
MFQKDFSFALRESEIGPILRSAVAEQGQLHLNEFLAVTIIL